MGSIPGSARSPEVGNGNPLQYSCLGNFMDRGAWWVTVHGESESHPVVSDSATPRTAARRASLSITDSWSLLKLMSLELVMSSSHLILCCPLLLLLQSFPASGASQMSQLFASGGKVLEFQLQHQSFQ